jgi:hypothetical protein
MHMHVKVDFRDDKEKNENGDTMYDDIMNTEVFFVGMTVCDMGIWVIRKQVAVNQKAMKKAQRK